jgi:hypothetical protein
MDGLRVRMFAPEDLLVVLCFHGARHMWERLAWLCDVHRLLQTEEIHWDRAFARAQRFGARRALGLGPWLCHRTLDAPLPADVLNRVRTDRTVMPLADEVHERLFRDFLGPSFSLGRQFHRFQLRCMDRRHDQARYLLRSVVVPQPEDWNAVPLPEPLFPLYYLIRPIRLAFRYAT